MRPGADINVDSPRALIGVCSEAVEPDRSGRDTRATGDEDLGPSVGESNFGPGHLE